MSPIDKNIFVNLILTYLYYIIIITQKEEIYICQISKMETILKMLLL